MQREYLFTSAKVTVFDRNTKQLTEETVRFKYAATDTLKRIENKVEKALNGKKFLDAEYEIIGELVEMDNDFFYNNGRVTKTRRIPLTFEDGKQTGSKITEAEQSDVEDTEQTDKK